MTLKDIINNFPFKNLCTIEYREIISIDSNDCDVLLGFAAFENNELIFLDGNTYSLEDEIIKYEFNKPDWLVVWIDRRNHMEGKNIWEQITIS